MTDFFKGLGYAFSGFKLVNRPGIRLFVIMPLLVNFIVFALLVGYGTSEFSELVNWIEGRWEWLVWIGWLLWPLFFLLVMTLAFFCFTVFANLIGSPFNGLLAEAVENDLLRQTGEGPVTDGTTLSVSLVVSAFASEIRKFAYILVRTLPLLLLFIIPYLQVFAPLIWLVFSAWILALEYIEYPLGNHDKEFREVRSIVASRRPLSLGFGLGITLMTMVPGLNLLAMPVSVCSATRLYVHQLKTE